MTQPSGDVQRAAFGWDAGCEPLVAVTRGGAVESVHRGVATVTDLVCGAHPPASGAARDQLAQRGETASPRHDGCSGKHAGMLTLALFLGAPTVGYERPSYPVQREIAAGVGRALGTEMLGLFSGVDGCVVPVLRISARQAATLYAPLVAGADRGLARIRDAMMARLELVAGQGFFDTRVMEAAPGVVLAKMGAEGAQGLALLPAAAPRPAAVGCCLKVVLRTPMGSRAEGFYRERGYHREYTLLGHHFRHDFLGMAKYLWADSLWSRRRVARLAYTDPGPGPGRSCPAPEPRGRCPLFRILYLFVIAEPPSWVAYVHSAAIIGLMGLVYYQSTKRRMGFMPMFVAMAGIFMVDLLAYIPYLGYLVWRDRRHPRPVDRHPRPVD